MNPNQSLTTSEVVKVVTVISAFIAAVLFLAVAHWPALSAIVGGVFVSLPIAAITAVLLTVGKGLLAVGRLFKR